MLQFRIKRLWIAGLLFLALGVAACAAPASAALPSAHTETEVPPSCEPRVLDVGDEFELRLDANGTTGCTWQVTDLDWSVVELLSIEYTEGTNPEQLLGAGGQAVLRFRALAQGHTFVQLAYGHAWEMDKATYDQRTVDVTVR